MNDDMLHAGALVVCGSTARGKSNRRAALSSPTITVHHTSYITTVYIYCWWNLVGPDPPPLRSVSNNPTWSMHVYGTYPGTVHLMGVQNGADLKYIHYTYGTHSYVHTVLYILYMCICMYSSREFGQNTIQQCCSYRSTVSRSLESTPSTAARIRSDDVVQLFPRALKRFIVGDRVALV